MGIVGKGAKAAVEFAVERGGKKAVKRSAKAPAKAAGLAVERVPKARPAAKPKGPSPRPAQGLRNSPSPFMVSTRRPSPAQMATQGNPDEELLLQTGDALRSSPAAFERNMAMLTEEPFMADMAGASADRVLDVATRRGADNLNFIANELMDPGTVEAAQHWYPAANEILGRMAQNYGLPPVAGHAVGAVTSPQTHWDVNVARAKRLMEMNADNFDFGGREGLRNVTKYLEMQGAKPERARGAIYPLGERRIAELLQTPMTELTDPFDRYAKVAVTDVARGGDRIAPAVRLDRSFGPGTEAMTWGSGNEINKALAILERPDMDTINAQLLGGGKVPSFFNNIAYPEKGNRAVTIDTHSSGAFGLYPAGANDSIAVRGMGASPAAKLGFAGASNPASGAKGYYGPIADAHLVSSKELGLDYPFASQSVTWEGLRQAWGGGKKTGALKAAVRDAWLSSSSPDEARYRIAELLGKPVRRAFAVNR